MGSFKRKDEFMNEVEKAEGIAAIAAAIRLFVRACLASEQESAKTCIFTWFLGGFATKLPSSSLNRKRVAFPGHSQSCQNQAVLQIPAQNPSLRPQPLCRHNAENASWDRGLAPEVTFPASFSSLFRVVGRKFSVFKVSVTKHTLSCFRRGSTFCIRHSLGPYSGEIEPKIPSRNQWSRLRLSRL